ncbi:Major Facilitator Superfamily (MFS) [Achlya hypogyna]|uniref:Major Facilitator Superfamily (MFS) n=1 Tax=Achlya hypogyna TaxID=1202772 RepID=A0A1V9YL86_ACHHY|nr:Major Facilitator Superfamily (MFS) [Achlya hypogyna]
MWLVDWFRSYWRVVVPPKTKEQADAERWLFAFPGSCQCRPFYRHYILLAGVTVQFACGVLFAMCIISRPFDLDIFGATTNNRNLRLTIESGIAVTLATAFVGPATERNGPRWSMAVGSLLTIAGLVCVQLALWTLVWAPLVLGCIGCGLGFGYLMVSSVATVQKWYPDMRGTALGTTMFGFGAGQIAWNASFAAVQRGMADDGMLQAAFLYMLLLLTPLLAFGVVVMRTPPCTFRVQGHDMHGIPSDAVPCETTLHDDYYNVGMTLINYTAVTMPRREAAVEGTDRHYHEQVRGLTLLQCIFSTDFVCVMLGFAAAACSGLLYVEIAAPHHEDRVMGWFNTTYDEGEALKLRADLLCLASRVLTPMLSDALYKVLYWNPAFARKVVFLLLLVVPTVALPLLVHHLDDFSRFQLLMYIVKIVAGGGFSLVGCFLTDLYGVYNMGTMYGLILATSSLSTLVVTVVFSGLKQDFLAQVRVMWICCFVGLVLMVVVRTNSMDRFYPGYQFSVCGSVVVQIPFAQRKEALTEGCVASAPSTTAASTKSVGYKGDGPFFLVNSDSEVSVEHILNV